MNIFVLDRNITKAAQYHVDSHVSKMILETAQLISSTLRLSGIDYGYKISHVNHPCRIWSSASKANFEWLKQLGIELGKEFKFRYNNQHSSLQVIQDAPLPPIQDTGLTSFVQAMDNEFRCHDAIQAYRSYYRGSKFDRGLIIYTNRQPPDWLCMEFNVTVKKNGNIVYKATKLADRNVYKWIS